MNESYADVLESYIIEPVEEGFGSTLIGTAAFIGGVALMGKISDINKRNKLKKEIRKNAGRPSDYRNSIFTILRRYSNSITGVLEPVASNEYVHLWSENLKVAKEAENIRIAFSKIDPTDKNSIEKYTQLNVKIEKLMSKVKGINDKLDVINLSELTTDVISLSSSNIKKLNDIVAETFDLLWSGGHDGYSLIMSSDVYFNLKVDDNDEAQMCINDFDKLVYMITDGDGPEDILRSYISKCKFAINPNSNLK